MAKPTLSLSKLHGCGNDFIFFDGYHTPWPEMKISRSEFAKQVCHRQFSVGADGFVIIEPSIANAETQAAAKTYDFAWDFYNADGSAAEMCGNAARCAVLFAREKKIASKNATSQNATSKNTKNKNTKNHHVRFQTIAGPIEAEYINDEQISIKMTEPCEFAMEQNIDLSALSESLKSSLLAQQPEFDLINTGVPHLVVQLQAQIPFNELKAQAAFLQQHPNFQPAQTNVTFYYADNHQHITAASYERGVADFTLACGTGAVAVALSHAKKTQGTQPITVQLPGGPVVVHPELPYPQLVGPAKWVAEIELYL